MEFTVLNSPKGFWRSLPEISLLLSSFLNPNHLRSDYQSIGALSFCIRKAQCLANSSQTFPHHADPQVGNQIRILLKDKCRKLSQNANTGNYTLISWTMLIGFLYVTETMRSKLSVTVYLFLALYGSTTLQSQSFLKNIENFLCK